MSKTAATLLVFAVLTSCFISIPMPTEAAPKTIVVPDDYPTIKGAIRNAAAGDTVLVKKGTYDEGETLEIDKTLTLIGEDNNNAIIELHPPYNETWILTAVFFTYSNAITINADNVKLSNFTIVIANPGGYISAIGDRTQITSNKIPTGPESEIIVKGSYCNITDNVSGASIRLSGFHNSIARNSVCSIIVNKDLNTISNNTVSVAFAGVQLSNANSNVISGNNMSTTTGDYGIYIVENSSHNIIYNNNIVALLSDVRINSHSAENNTFYHNNFLIQYGSGLAELYTYNLTLINFWDNGEEGNYWQGYNFTDANRDGIGDTPYVIDGANIDNYPLMFPFDIENDTIVLPPPEPFPTIAVLIIVVSVVLVSTGVLVYFMKRKH